ncbi:hypothetical protein JP0006_12550 [Helicobacter pylori]
MKVSFKHFLRLESSCLWVLDLKAELKFRISIIRIKGKKGTPYLNKHVISKYHVIS